MELRKIFVRKLLATCTSLSDGMPRGDTTSTILSCRCQKLQIKMNLTMNKKKKKNVKKKEVWDQLD